MAKQTVGEFLAILRKAKGLTQQEVAEKLNISNRTLSSWETDRTVPDIIMLPAIADLYGVTVDELLRGERGERENQAEFSKEALNAARKHQFAKFSLKNVILISFSCLSAVLFITAACINLFTSSPLWLDAVIASLGGVGVIACTISEIYFYYKAKYGGGIILSEDLTDDKKSYILALKRKFKTYFLISAIPLLLFAIVLGGFFCAYQPHDSYYFYDNHFYLKVTVHHYLKTRCLVFWLIPLTVGASMTATYFICGNTGLKNIMNETQAENHKYNLKLAAILSGCGAVPVVIMFIVFMCFIGYYEDGYHLYAVPLYIPLVLILALSIVVCSVIYAVKRKKLY